MRGGAPYIYIYIYVILPLSLAGWLDATARFQVKLWGSDIRFQLSLWRVSDHVPTLASEIKVGTCGLGPILLLWTRFNFPASTIVVKVYGLPGFRRLKD